MRTGNYGEMRKICDPDKHDWKMVDCDGDGIDYVCQKRKCRSTARADSSGIYIRPRDTSRIVHPSPRALEDWDSPERKQILVKLKSDGTLDRYAKRFRKSVSRSG